MLCQNCNYMNEEGAKFCAKCGAPLSVAQPEQPQVEQPQVQQPFAPQMPFTQPAAPVAEPGKGMAIASLVLGIVSFFCFAPVAGILAIVFGAVAKNKGYKGGMATAGIICGAIALALWFIFLIIGLIGASVGFMM